MSRTSAASLAPRLAAFGTGTGLLAGFFGIGGGFLVVPGLIAGARMSLLAAIGSSLVSVFAFGLTIAGNYALSGFIDWRLVALFVLGGFGGSLFGGRLAARLAGQKRTLTMVFATIVAGVGLYVTIRGSLG
ncbi:TSUP family transporter [Bradyrhizobium japonicum]|uniref:TSUP family transporter n=1 Tax=Bradyrhizobium japonicum TaxID=375 RepID=UPI001FD93CD2|nr:TSUP family transporter [Bradyrhizobium japonicum]